MLPNNFGSWNPAMRGAFVKGITAAQEGASIDDCPYHDKRKASGKLSWSRAFINAWCDGFDYARRFPDDALITMQFARSFNKRKA